jgi:3-phytase
VVPETFITPFDAGNNIDSPAFYTSPSGESWILSTAKTANFILVSDAASGKNLRTVGTSGIGAGQLQRPNGIVAIDSLVLVVERDNHRVQGFLLPDFKPAGFFGQSILIKPYGISAFRLPDGSYSVYVTDNYETMIGGTPPDGKLGARVKQFSVSIAAGQLAATLVRSFGDTTPPGALRVVESVIADPANNQLAIAEEMPGDSYIKMYDLTGHFTGRTMGKGNFPQQAEGIALYSCSDGSGYWIGTDQGDVTNTYTIFDRKTLEPVGAFTGSKARRTDGIVLTQKAYGPFPAGAFFVSHLDGSVAAFSWAAIADSLKLRKDCLS